MAKMTPSRAKSDSACDCLYVEQRSENFKHQMNKNQAGFKDSFDFQTRLGAFSLQIKIVPLQAYMEPNWQKMQVWLGKKFES